MSKFCKTRVEEQKKAAAREFLKSLGLWELSYLPKFWLMLWPDRTLPQNVVTAVQAKAESVIRALNAVAELRWYRRRTIVLFIDIADNLEHYGDSLKVKLRLDREYFSTLYYTLVVRGYDR